MINSGKKREPGFWLSFVFILIITTADAQVPVISSFSPVSGPVGTSVIINGSNFDPLPANNKVFFGPVEATVTAAASSSLTVNVPIGANYQPITVTVNHLTGYSAQPFIVTFPITSPINANTFGSHQDYSSGVTPFGVAAGDIDGDGKPDLLFTNTNGTFSVLRNTGTPGTISFDSVVTFNAANGSNGIATGDFDGDGKLDVAVCNAFSATLSVLKNTSTPGNISFDPKISLSAGSNQTSVAITDIDGDGKPDVAVTTATNLLIIFRNNSINSISFEDRLDFAAGPAPRTIATGDLNGDNKQDLVVANQSGSTFSVFKNTSTAGTVAFDTRLDVFGDFSPYGCAIADLDGDGKPDVAVTQPPLNHVTLYRNTSSVDTISFAFAVNIGGLGTSRTILVNDIDGDSKPDIVTGNDAGTIAVMKNASVLDTFKFNSKTEYPIGSTVSRIISCDWDGDGIADMAATNASKVAVFKNRINEPYIISFDPVFGATGSVITLKGKNFIGVTAVNIGGAPASSFSVISPDTILATVGSAAAGDISVTTPVGTYTITGFTLPPPKITSFSPLADTLGATVTITGSNFGTDNIVFFGSAKATIVSATATTIKVKVPAGTSYQPISVTTRNLTAFSRKPFCTKFYGGDSITSSSFNPKIDIVTGDNPQNAAVADIDGDGKPDVAVCNFIANTVSILRNTSVPGTISFAPKTDISSSVAPAFVAFGDLDGDGKPDLIVSYNSTFITVYQNTSSSGSISFAAKKDISGVGNPRSISVCDINMDGKPDLVVSNTSINFPYPLSLFKNTTLQPGAISFAQPFFTPMVDGYSFRTISGEMDNDGMPDLLSLETSNSFPITLRNTTTAGGWTFSYERSESLNIALVPFGLSLTDLNNDNKLDVILADQDYVPLPGLAVFENTSIPANLSFNAETRFLSGSYPMGLASNDFNGDGKPDMVAGISVYNNPNSYISVYQNTSVQAGNISLVNKGDFPSGNSPYEIVSADLDMDGKPDIITTNRGANTISVIRDKAGDPQSVLLCPPVGSAAITSTFTGSTYQWQVNTGSGFINISDNSNYAGTTSASLQLNNIPSSWYGYVYRCLVNGIYTELFKIKFSNNWIGGANSNWEDPANWSCGIIPDMNTDVVVNSGTVVVNVNTTIRTLTLAPGVNLTVAPGVTLTITNP